MKPLVSVLLPAYRADATIAEAVHSVLAGGLPADQIEILVESDDGSDYAMIRDLPAVALAVTGAVGTGAGAARNRALARAKGRFITYIDADDIWQQGWLTALLPLAQHWGAALSPLQVMENNTEILRLWQGQQWFCHVAAAQSGASMRGLIARGLFTPFAQGLAQDIHHMLGVLSACGGRLPLSDRAYVLRLQGASVTAAADFSARVHRAYCDYIAAYEAEEAAFAAQNAQVFRAKIALNEDYEKAGRGESYYRFIARKLGARL